MWKLLLPREHALWGWVGVPLLGVLVLHPTLGTAAGAGAVIAGFGAWNAASRVLRGIPRAGMAAGVGGAAAAALGAAALVLDEHPAVLAGALVAALGAGSGVLGVLRGHLRQDPWWESVGILGFCALAGAVAVGAGAPAVSVALLEALIGAWLLAGLWWINRSLAPLLKDRRLWSAGPWVAGGAAAGVALAAVGAGAPLVAVLPALYPARVALQRPAVAPRDARRLGLAELGWGVLVATAGAVALHP